MALDTDKSIYLGSRSPEHPAPRHIDDVAASSTDCNIAPIAVDPRARAENENVALTEHGGIRVQRMESPPISDSALR